MESALTLNIYDHRDYALHEMTRITTPANIVFHRTFGEKNRFMAVATSSGWPSNEVRGVAARLESIFTEAVGEPGPEDVQPPTPEEFDAAVEADHRAKQAELRLQAIETTLTTLKADLAGFADRLNWVENDQRLHADELDGVQEKIDELRAESLKTVADMGVKVLEIASSLVAKDGVALSLRRIAEALWTKGGRSFS